LKILSGSRRGGNIDPSRRATTVPESGNPYDSRIASCSGSCKASQFQIPVHRTMVSKLLVNGPRTFVSFSQVQQNGNSFGGRHADKRERKKMYIYALVGTLYSMCTWELAGNQGQILLILLHVRTRT
jgi:hypothetical protein